MNNRRKLVIALGVGVVASPFGSFAQQATKIARIGFLGLTSASGSASRIEAMQAGLRNLGYVDGKNILIEYRWADEKYDRLPDLAAELVRLKVDLLVAQGTAAALAAKQATTTIPIVFVGVGDAIASGLVTSLARPGGNVTGSTIFAPELMGKRLELAKEIYPHIRQVAVLLVSDNPAKDPIFHATEITARSLKIQLQRFEARGPGDFDGIFAAMAKGRVGAILVHEEPTFAVNARAIADFAKKKHIPLFGGNEFADAGSLIGYGINRVELFRQASISVDKILKGANPGDLPVERPIKFDLVINMKTAKALGIKVPNSILVQATKVIE